MQGDFNIRMNDQFTVMVYLFNPGQINGTLLAGANSPNEPMLPWLHLFINNFQLCAAYIVNGTKKQKCDNTTQNAVWWGWNTFVFRFSENDTLAWSFYDMKISNSLSYNFSNVGPFFGNVTKICLGSTWTMAGNDQQYSL